MVSKTLDKFVNLCYNVVKSNDIAKGEQKMQRVKSPNGSTYYANSRKFQVGEWYESLAGEWYIITSVLDTEAEIQGEYGIDKMWLHTLRKATAEELARRERQRAEWNAKSPDERISKTINFLAKSYPGLDW